MPFILEQSHAEIYASAGGLAVVGPIINRHSGLKKRLKSLPLRHGIAHIDLVRTYLGLLCQGKNDFEAVEGVRDNLFFRHALGIVWVPSSAWRRQRFDEQAVALTAAADDCLVPLLSNLKAPVTALPSGHLPLHADLFCLDNGKTHKQGVSRTHDGYDGYAPIGAYLGEEGWCVGLELRPGEQHSQKDFAFFLDRVLPRAKALAGARRLLVTLDGAHDAAANRKQLQGEDVDYLIKWNPRGEDPQHWYERAEREARFIVERADKRVATFDETILWTFEGKSHQARRVVRLTERTADRHGQPLLFPALELQAWWTNLASATVDADALIGLYQRRGTSEQYHSDQFAWSELGQPQAARRGRAKDGADQFKTDLDLERLPSRKFDTNALVFALAALAYNILRYIGQDTLLGPDAPIRKAVHRRRLRTVLPEMIYKAARLIRHGRRTVLRFGRGDPGYTALARCYARLST